MNALERILTIKNSVTQTTPKAINKEIKDFCATINNSTPLFVDVNPVNEIYNNCFFTVADQVKDSGGLMQCGWMIWQSKLWLEAEAHCVYINPNGVMIDITPKQDGETKIVFLPDDNVRFNGYLIPSKHKARKNDRITKDIVSLANYRSKILSIEPFDKISPKTLAVIHEIDIKQSLLLIQAVNL